MTSEAETEPLNPTVSQHQQTPTLPEVRIPVLEYSSGGVGYW